MTVPILSTPPEAGISYIIDQLEGERITIHGSKGAFRILASSKQTDGGIAVFTSGSVIADAPGFHYHDEAHDVFLVTKGYLKLWNGEQCRILGPGDFAYVPPKVIHNPEQLGPHTETLGLVAPGDWVDFFRYVSEAYEGILVPEGDDRNLREHLMGKMMVAKDRFDVHFERGYNPPALANWDGSEDKLGEPGKPYFLRANTGPRWMLGSVMSRPFIHASQTGERFAISSIESSNAYKGPSLFSSTWLNFPKTAHCFYSLEGLLRFKTRSSEQDEWNQAREGQTVVIAAGESFQLDFASRYVRVWTFTNGFGIEEIIHRAGNPCPGVVLPDRLETHEWDEDRVGNACQELGVQLAKA